MPYSNEVREATSAGREAQDFMPLAHGLMQRVSYVMAGCVYVCEDGGHQWPCGIPGRHKLCPAGKRWIQQIG
jgi:hypothetical protein